MKILETDPGKADPLQGMKPADLLKLLMGSFTQDQWQIAASENGIGFGDLTTEQAQIFDHLLPTEIRVQKSTVADGATSGAVAFNNVQSIVVQDRGTVRIRFNREVSIGLHARRDNGIYMGGNALDYKPGETVVQMLPSKTYGSEVVGEERASMAFGVLLLKTVQNRQKPSDLDYAAPALDARVPLDSLEKGTVGQLVTRAGAAAHLHIVADYRVKDLPIYARGAEARAGDILQTLALGVTGTFRKVGAPATYLLTDDLEGIGARLTRLEYWAKQAEEQRFKLLVDAKSRAAKQHPLEYLKFAAGDKLALSADEQQKIDARYSSGPHNDMADESESDLDPALRNEVARDIEAWRTQENVQLDPSKITLGMQLSTCFIIPDVGIVKDVYASLSSGPLNLQDLVAVPERTLAPAAKGSASSAAIWLNGSNARRILLAAPASVAEAKRLVTDVRQRGFNELWVRVQLDGGPDATEILRTALAAHSVPVVAVVSLLHAGGAPGTPEKTILGQTGAEFAVDYVSGKSTDVPAKGLDSSDEKNRLITEHYSDWIQADRSLLDKRVAEIAAVPGLAGLAVEGLTPPGFSKPTNDYGEFVLTGGSLGYTESRRTALIAAKNLDPIDIRGKTLALTSVNLALPFFPDDSQSRAFTDVNGQLMEDKSTISSQETWDGILYKENETLARDVFTGIRASHPGLPLFIDDRASDFVSANSSWFGSWDSPTNLPRNDIFGEPQTAPVIARLSSKTILLKGAAPEIDMSKDPYGFAGFLAGMSERASLGWNGLIIDVQQVPFARTLELLGSISAPNK